MGPSQTQHDDRDQEGQARADRSHPNGKAPVEPAWRPHFGFGEMIAYLRDLASPRYHLRKLREDLRASRHALKNRDLEAIRHDVESLTRAIRGRLVAVYFMVGPFGSLGFFAGLWFQYVVAQDLPFSGVLTMLVTVTFGNIGSIIGFQTIWFWAHRNLYRDEEGTFWGQVMDMWRDIVPMQVHGIKLWAGANVVLLPAMALFLAALEAAFPRFVKLVPIAVVAPALEVVFLHTTLIRLMGDLFESESERMARRHTRALVRAEVS